MGVHSRNVGNYASGFSALGFQVQQVARELPSLAVSPQQFFLAISNNIPMLRDQIALTQQANKEMKAMGKDVVPVGKQLATAILSWQTALIVGLTLLSKYGGEIIKWAGNMIKGTKAINTTEEAIRGATNYQPPFLLGGLFPSLLNGLLFPPPVVLFLLSVFVRVCAGGCFPDGVFGLSPDLGLSFNCGFSAGFGLSFDCWITIDLFPKLLPVTFISAGALIASQSIHPYVSTCSARCRKVDVW